MEFKNYITNWKTLHQSKIKEVQYSIYRIKKSPLTIVGIVIIFSIFFIAVIAPYIIPYPDDVGMKVNINEKLKPPSFKHPFGTDDLGRDLFSRVIYGTRISIQIGFTVVIISSLIGVPLGAIAGFMGGKVDETIMRIADIFMSIPSLILAVAIAAALGPSIGNVMIAISIPWWPWYTRVVRGQVLVLREKVFVEVAESIGSSKRRIIFSHILPNCMGVVIVQSSLQIGNAILTAAALSFVGVGAQPPTPEWGLILSVGRLYKPQNWWFITIPGIAISITVLGVNLLGDGLRDILDPRMRR